MGIYKYPIRDLNAYIKLYPQSGDKLLVRAVITDTTIFCSRDTYPDSGYAEIHVLPSIVGIKEEIIPNSVSLLQNYPNPFNPLTTIEYTIPSTTFVSLSFYDILGNLISIPVNEEKQPGIHKYEFNAEGLSSGFYFCKLNAGGIYQIIKMILLK